MEAKLKHQMQPCQTSCMCTCIAMILDVPAQVIIDRFHTRYREKDMSIREMFTELHVKFMSWDSADRNSMGHMGSGYYLSSVPSLNVQGGLHSIVLEFDADELLWIVHDPQKGTGFKYYEGKKNPDDDNSFALTGGYNLDAGVTQPALNFWREERSATDFWSELGFTHEQLYKPAM